jgi:hypothetical protein
MEKQNKKSTKIIIVIVILIIIGVVFYVFVDSRGSQQGKFANIDNSATSTKNVNFDPLNFTYVLEDEKVTLTDGVSTQDIVPGSAEKLETTVFEKPAIGDLNKDNKNDSSLLLVQDSGGTGLFFYLVAVVSDVGVVKNTNSIFIGDRIDPVSILIENGKIKLSFIDRGTDEPMTAEPTIKITKYFEVKNNILMEVK